MSSDQKRSRVWRGSVGVHAWPCELVIVEVDKTPVSIAIQDSLTSPHFSLTATFAWAWGPHTDARTAHPEPKRPPPEEPTAFFVDLPLGETNDDDVTLLFSVKEMVDDFVDLHQKSDEPGVMEAQSVPRRDFFLSRARALSAEARRLQDFIESAEVEGGAA